MKKSLFIFVFCSLGISWLSAQEVRLVKIEDVLEEMNKEDDTTRVLNLWATWCAPCVHELPFFEEVYQETRANQKTKIILLAVEDSEGKVKKLILAKGINATVWLLDEKYANEWISQIEEDWGGEIPVTRTQNNSLSKTLFHSGELSKEELLEMIKETSSRL
jgi:thiol-disulfide isomerase/thioredoxin